MKANTLTRSFRIVLASMLTAPVSIPLLTDTSV